MTQQQIHKIIDFYCTGGTFFWINTVVDGVTHSPLRLHGPPKGLLELQLRPTPSRDPASRSPSLQAIISEYRDNRDICRNCRDYRDYRGYRNYRGGL